MTADQRGQMRSGRSLDSVTNVTTEHSRPGHRLADVTVGQIRPVKVRPDSVRSIRSSQTRPLSLMKNNI